MSHSRSSLISRTLMRHPAAVEFRSVGATWSSSAPMQGGQVAVEPGSASAARTAATTWRVCMDLASLVDDGLEVSVVGSFSRVGFALRRLVFGWAAPPDGALAGRT